MSTYLELTNELLRRINEVELTSTTFASARGIQATAKDCIRAGVNEIMSSEKEWVFNYTTGTQLLTVGTEEYTLPVNCEVADWESFRIEKDDILGVNTTPLNLISKNYWYQHLRPSDEDSGTTGIRMPESVFMSTYNAQLSFGVTPSPERAYTVAFDYYLIDDELDLYSDSVRIPVRFNFVIMACALKHFNLFKDNIEQGSFWTKESEMAISKMRAYLAPRKDDVTDTRTNFGGQNWRTVFDVTGSF